MTMILLSPPILNETTSLADEKREAKQTMVLILPINITFSNIFFFSKKTFFKYIIISVCAFIICWEKKQIHINNRYEQM